MKRDNAPRITFDKLFKTMNDFQAQMPTSFWRGYVHSPAEMKDFFKDLPEAKQSDLFFQGIEIRVNEAVPLDQIHLVNIEHGSGRLIQKWIFQKIEDGKWIKVNVKRESN